MKVTADTIELSVVNSNLLHYQKPEPVEADCLWVRDNWFPDFWVVEEAYSYEQVLSSIPDYALAVPENMPAALGRNRILYNTKFSRLVSVEAIEMHPTVEGEYALRMLAVAHFQDVFDGNDFWVFGMHLDPGIEVKGRPVLPSTKTEASIKMIADIAPMVTAKARGRGIALWAGDLNIDAFRDRAVNDKRLAHYVFSKNGLLSVYDELRIQDAPEYSTVGNSTIDWIGRHTLDSRLRALNVEVSPPAANLNSDHEFVKATFELHRLPPVVADPPA